MQSMTKRSTGYAAALTMLLLTLPLISGAKHGEVHAQGTTTAGGPGVETRNQPVHVEAGATITGPIQSRNGRVTVGEGAEVRTVTTRGGQVTLGERVRADAVSTRNGRITVGPRAQVGSLNTRNGHIEAGAYTTIHGPVESRNGRVDLGEGVQVEGDVDTRNGAIDLAPGVRVRGTVESRNGQIRLAEDGLIEGHVRTRNGAVHLAAGSSVDGHVRTRNGAVRLEHARVAHHIDVMNGDVHLGGTSRVEGDLILLMPEDRGSWSWLPFIESTGRTPVIRIDADAYIGGRLIVDERARIEIEPGADVPEPEILPSREAWERQ